MNFLFQRDLNMGGLRRLVNELRTVLSLSGNSSINKINEFRCHPHSH